MGRKRRSSKHVAQQRNTVTEVLNDLYLGTFSTRSPLFLATCQRDVATQRAKVWSVDDKGVAQDIALPHGATVVALSWGTSTNFTTVTDSVLAMCLSTGDVQIYSVVMGKIVKTLSGTHTAVVNDFVFTEDGKRGFSIGNDFLIVEWDLTSDTVLRTSKYKGKVPPQKIALSSNEKMLAIADSSVFLWDVQSLKHIRNFSAHASQIMQIAFINNDTCLVTSAENDRFINCFDISSLTESVQQTKDELIVIPMVHSLPALSLDQTVTTLTVNLNTNHIMAIAENGVVHVWNQLQNDAVPKESDTSDIKRRRKRQRYTSRTAKSTIMCVEADAEDLAQVDTPTPIPIIAATFSPITVPGQPSSVCIARGTFLRPIFEMIQYTSDDENGHAVLLPNQILERTSQSALFAHGNQMTIVAGGQKVLKTKQVYKEGQEITTLDSVDFVLPSQKRNFQTNGSSKTNETVNMGLTLAEKLALLQPSNITPDTITTTANGTVTLPDIRSLHLILMQAIHTHDRPLLDSVLDAACNRTGKDSKRFATSQQIHSTVAQLSTPHIVPFLNILISRFQKYPGRAFDLLEWIRACLIIHAGYLMTVPDLVKNMSLFYQTVEHRLAMSKKLLKLQGRLELVLSQVTLHSDARAKAMPVYNEGADTTSHLLENHQVNGENGSQHNLHIEEDDDAHYEDLSHPSLSGNNLRPVKRRAETSMLQIMAGDADQEMRQETNGDRTTLYNDEDSESDDSDFSGEELSEYDSADEEDGAEDEDADDKSENDNKGEDRDVDMNAASDDEE